jgi:ABC-type oligopeptide transport system ATPase subunit
MGLSVVFHETLGSGKTVLFKTIIGFLKPTSGKVIMNVKNGISRNGVLLADELLVLKEKLSKKL